MLTGSIGKSIDGAIPFATSSLMFRIVCWRVKTLLVSSWHTLSSAAVVATAEVATATT
jgi:hypothetical protein